MKNIRRGALAAAVAGIVVGLPIAPAALAQETVADALRAGNVDLNLRLRFEDVSQDGVTDSDALTLRTRLTYTTGNYQGLSGVLEFDDVTALNDMDYNDGTGINPGTALIPDPEGTEVNQAYLAYQNFNTTFRYGRQRILLDNQRFIGGVGWRQNEQTYDAVSATNEAFADLQLFYAYVFNVNRIFGEGIVAGDHDQQTHLLNARYSGWQPGNLAGYAYLIDNESAPALANDTYGVRWEGHINDNLAYNLEYARQSDAGNNPADYSASYWLAEGVGKANLFTFTAGYEILGSDSGEAAFSTPLATGHKFQGWTDKFLTTPAAGIEDFYVSAATQVQGYNLAVVYHDFSANEGSMDYGSEVGFQVDKKVGPVGLTFKYADYSADEFATDTRKFWLMAAASF